MRQGNSVLVAITNPNDISVLDDLRILLQCNIKPTLSKKTEIMDGIHRAYEPTTKVDPSLHQDLMDDLEEQNLTSVDLNETQDLLDSDDEAPSFAWSTHFYFVRLKNVRVIFTSSPLKKIFLSDSALMAFSMKSCALRKKRKPRLHHVLRSWLISTLLKNEFHRMEELKSNSVDDPSISGYQHFPRPW